MRDRQHERKAARPDSKTSSASHRHRRNEIPASTVNTFSQCFEYAALGLSVTDLEGRFLDVNSAFCALTGYTETELSQRVDLETLVHPADLPNALEKIRALIAGEIPAFIVEHRYIKKDDSSAWVQNNVSLIRNKAGQPASIAWLTQDISERKRAQDSLAALEESRTARN